MLSFPKKLCIQPQSTKARGVTCMERDLDHPPSFYALESLFLSLSRALAFDGATWTYVRVLIFQNCLSSSLSFPPFSARSLTMCSSFSFFLVGYSIAICSVRRYRIQIDSIDWRISFLSVLLRILQFHLNSSRWEANRSLADGGKQKIRFESSSSIRLALSFPPYP